jgi:hypothetical protein
MIGAAQRRLAVNRDVLFDLAEFTRARQQLAQLAALDGGGRLQVFDKFLVFFATEVIASDPAMFYQ